jgi:hypothetical protein
LEIFEESVLDTFYEKVDEFKKHSGFSGGGQ